MEERCKLHWVLKDRGWAGLEDHEEKISYINYGKICGWNVGDSLNLRV